MSTVYLVRHGEAGDERISDVTYTPKNEYDKPLTRLGLTQAERLRGVFTHLNFSHSYTSDYLRAIETFDQLNVSAAKHSVLPEIREIFCECIGKNLGNTDLAEFQRQKERVQRFIDNHLLTLAGNDQVIVVAHGCFILYLLKKLTGKSFGHDMANTGVTKLTYNGSWDFEFFNESAHLFEPVDPSITRLVCG